MLGAVRTRVLDLDRRDPRAGLDDEIHLMTGLVPKERQGRCAAGVRSGLQQFQKHQVLERNPFQIIEDQPAPASVSKTELSPYRGQQ